MKPVDGQNQHFGRVTFGVTLGTGTFVTFSTQTYPSPK